jgi:anti-sigma-K factor RskA
VTSGDEDDDNDLTAAEYVIGLLTPAEAREVEKQAATDDALAASIARWEARLHPLNYALPPRPAPADVWLRLERELGIAPRTRAERVPGRPRRDWGDAWRQLVRGAGPWRLGRAYFAGGVIGAAIMGAILWPRVNLTQPAVAALSQEGTGPAYLVMVGRDGHASIVTVGAQPQDDFSLELWGVPEGQTAPIRLTLLPMAGPFRMPNGVGVGATLLVSREPKGGAPGNGPTGPVVLSGKLLKG